jgi:hypothetical protein
MDYPKSNNYVTDDVLDKLKVVLDAALKDDWSKDDTNPEDCFLNHMTTDEKPNPNIDKIMFRNMNQEIRSLRRRNYSFRKYIRLLHRIINFRDREIRELKRNQIVVNINSKPKFGKSYHITTVDRLRRKASIEKTKD